MRVLYISQGQSADYQCDMLLHGLRSLLGPDCVDVNRVWYMYRDSFGPGKHSLSECYGRGFTLFGLLPDDSGVDRTDIPTKINARYFDLVIYGSVHRDLSYLNNVCAFYRREQIVFIDGEDGPGLHSVVGRGWYFKRELYEPHPDVLPIQFAIPREKVSPAIPAKTRLMSPYIPWELPYGHIYDNEADYYADYGQSYFARTRKKGGWDCMRHYEIIAAGALPYFEELESCPASTLNWLPKLSLLVARNLCDHWSNDTHEWESDMDTVRRTLLEHLTTEALAKRVLNEVLCSAGN